jgi:predicted RNA-binding Zn ribbon-like protein
MEFGGKIAISAMATSYDADLVGGHPALDFLNTIHDWTSLEPLDRLGDFEAAIAFAEAAGLLTRVEARRLVRPEPRSGGAELARLRGLRASLERIFRALVESGAPAASDLAGLAAVGIEVARATRWRNVAGGPPRPEVALEAAGEAVVRLRVAAAAAELLTSAQLERLKACGGCGWFFLDRSKNRSRRWCSMDTCGASAKAKTYYRRRRGRR